jgi:C4-dicarboxylate-binding protein DctP
MVIANADWWNGLPDDVKQGLSEAMAESIAYGNKVALEEDATFRQKVIDDKKAKLVKLTKQQREQWRNAMRPVWAKFEGEIGKDLIDAALAANVKPTAEKKKQGDTKK